MPISLWFSNKQAAEIKEDLDFYIETSVDVEAIEPAADAYDFYEVYHH